MKKYLIVLLSALSISGLNAQESALAGTKFGDNWSIGLNGGIVSPLTHSAFFKNARAVVGLDINKQLSPIYGVTLESNWTINTQSPMAHREKACTAFDAFDVMLLHRLNLNNIFAGYKGAPRFFEVEAVAGAGWLRLNKFYDKSSNSAANHIASKAGLNFNFNLGESKAWTVAVKPAILWDLTRHDQSTNYNYHLKYNANFANWEITAGVAYHFKNSNGERYITKVQTCDPAKAAELNDAINKLRKELADKDASLKDAEDNLNKEQQKAADLQKALEDCQNKAPQVIDNSKKTLESVVTFRQGKTTIESSQLPNVERVATYLKNHKDAKVNILGYASPEGSAEVNARIANQRAQAVKDTLINKYKIKASRITAEGQGVGNMFEEADWNRVSICTIAE